MLFAHNSPELEEAYADASRLLSGVTSIACLGDVLALSAFSLVAPIRRSLLGACSKQTEAVALMEKDLPRLLFTSEVLEQGYGIDLIRTAKRMSDGVICLLFLRRETPDVVEEALEAGADGVMFVSSLGGMGDGDFMLALRTTLNGGIYYPRSVTNTVRRSIEKPAWAGDLTGRERETLRLLCEGMSNDEMASEMSLTIATVKTHLSSIYSKVGVHDRTKCLIAALRAGLFD